MISKEKVISVLADINVLRGLRGENPFKNSEVIYEHS